MPPSPTTMLDSLPAGCQPLPGGSSPPDTNEWFLRTLHTSSIPGLTRTRRPLFPARRAVGGFTGDELGQLLEAIGVGRGVRGFQVHRMVGLHQSRREVRR